MKRLFPLAVVGCLMHAFAATLSQFLLAVFCDASFKNVPFLIYSVLAITWPLWVLAFWKFARFGLRPQSAVAMICGLIIFSPVLLLTAYTYTGRELSDNFFFF
jgi:hypothetical protein